jgi:hypothetical protein
MADSRSLRLRIMFAGLIRRGCLMREITIFAGSSTLLCRM